MFMTKAFLDNDFLLMSKTAQRLYHDYAAHMPIIDYHNHLPPAQIANDHAFKSITEAWLYGDHYKWRAMRTQGVSERFCTGDATDEEKFIAWAETVPYTLRNPLYHWTHLELQRYFDIHQVLNAHSAKEIYTMANAKLRSPDYSVQGLLRKMQVKVLCTTDDPIDSLEYHMKFANTSTGLKMLPAFRPDKAMAVENPTAFNQWVDKLSEITGMDIRMYRSFLEALKARHDFFAQHGCSVSDHGLEQMYAADYTESEINAIFLQVRTGASLDPLSVLKFKSAVLHELALWNHEKGWVQQFHLGALRNNNQRMLRLLGPDTGWDSIGDFSQARALAAFLGRLDSQDKLTKTILYNLNPADNEMMATMIGNFNDGSVAGKIQWGSAWWFLDQKDGMTKQIDALSNMGLLSRFVGMLTDSRSFLSYPRHEYFRRILCNLFGTEIEQGELPNDIAWTGKIIQDICYNNAANYFGWNENA
jgi:glucuronate isomerase